MLSTTQKGDIGSHMVCADLIENEFIVLLPNGGQPHYDLVIEKDGVFRRVQVKYVTEQNGIIWVRLFTTGHESKINYHTIDEVDIFAVYEPLSKKVYYINRKDFKNVNSIYLRTVSPKVNRKDVHLADDFLKLRL